MLANGLAKWTHQRRDVAVTEQTTLILHAREQNVSCTVVLGCASCCYVVIKFDHFATYKRCVLLCAISEQALVCALQGLGRSSCFL